MPPSPNGGRAAECSQSAGCRCLLLHHSAHPAGWPAVHADQAAACAGARRSALPQESARGRRRPCRISASIRACHAARLLWHVLSAVPPAHRDGLESGASGGAQAPMFKAPAVAFEAAATDFLVVRHPTGRLALREFQGAIAVGQQEPHLRVPVPNTKDKRCAASCHTLYAVFELCRVLCIYSTSKQLPTTAAVGVLRVAATKYLGNWGRGDKLFPPSLPSPAVFFPTPRTHAAAQTAEFLGSLEGRRRRR